MAVKTYSSETGATDVISARQIGHFAFPRMILVAQSAHMQECWHFVKVTCEILSVMSSFDIYHKVVF